MLRQRRPFSPSPRIVDYNNSTMRSESFVPTNFHSDLLIMGSRRRGRKRRKGKDNRKVVVKRQNEEDAFSASPLRGSDAMSSVNADEDGRGVDQNKGNNATEVQSVVKSSDFLSDDTTIATETRRQNLSGSFNAFDAFDASISPPFSSPSVEDVPANSIEDVFQDPAKNEDTSTANKSTTTAAAATTTTTTFDISDNVIEEGDTVIEMSLAPVYVYLLRHIY